MRSFIIHGNLCRHYEGPFYINKKYFDEHGLEAICGKVAARNNIRFCAINKITDEDVGWVVKLLNSSVGDVIPRLDLNFDTKTLSTEAINIIRDLIADMPALRKIVVRGEFTRNGREKLLAPLMLPPGLT